jgi:hypothetical protein
MTESRPRRLFDGMRFFVTQCAMKTLHRIDENQPHQPAHSDLILSMLVNSGGMVTVCVATLFQCVMPSQVIVNRVNPKRSLNHNNRFAVRCFPSHKFRHSVLTTPQVRGEEFSLLRDATHVVCDSTHALNPAAAM